MPRSAAAVVLVTLLAGGPALAADIYRWKDAAGQVHYTDDPATIPSEYRAIARKTPGEELATLSIEISPPAPPAGRAPRPAQGAPDEQLWRSRFREARERIARLEGAVKADRELLEQARRELAELERRASEEAVPREWRR